MSHSNAGAASLLVENLSLLKSLNCESTVLDLACGSGRNGLFLARHNVPVKFADNNEAELKQIADCLGRFDRCWLVDLEKSPDNGGLDPLAGKRFDGILVFNYLHRPLMTSIKNAVRHGGLVFYETFTVKQRDYGRPRNPDYLLQPGELARFFEGWEILHSFEGDVGTEGESENPRRAIASLIARKP